MKLVAKLTKNKTHQAILLASTVLLGSAALAYIFGYVRQIISGEGLYDLMYADRYPFIWDWLVFFKERVAARFMHGVIISSIYQVTSFNPPLIYLSSIVATIATSAVIAFVLSDFIQKPWQAFVLTLTLSILPLVVPELTNIKKIHHAFAWLFFWLAVLGLQHWFAHKKKTWLIAGAGFFIAAFLSYEAIAALLPVAIILSAKQIKGRAELWKAILTVGLVTLLAVGVFFASEALRDTSSIRGVDGSNLGSAVQRAILSPFRIPGAIWNAGLINAAPPGALAMNVSKAGLVALAAVMAFLVVNALRTRKTGGLANPAVILGLTALWLSVVTYLPFAFGGQNPDTDSLKGAAYGVIILALAIAIWLEQSGAPRIAMAVFLGVSLFFVIVGINSYAYTLNLAKPADERFTRFVYSLKEQVPGVKENSTFIFVNAGFGRTGCIGLMNMLYGRERVSCIHLFDGDTEESYTRMPDHLLEDVGRVFEQDFIILTVAEDGTMILLDEITQSEYPLVPISWQFNAPIATNFDRIQAADTGPETSFYMYMAKQYEEISR
jgi:hypothetical protein